MDYNFGLTPTQLSAPPTPAAPINGPAGATASNSGVGSLLPSSNAKYVETDGKHKGLAGTARNVLGFLGDFLLKHLGMPMMYGPDQEKRKLGIAEEGLGTTPQATADAISRVNSIDPVMAIKLRDQYIDNQRQAVSAASVQEARKAREDALADKTRTDVRNRVASYMNGIGSLSEDKIPDAYAQARNLWTNSATVKNDPELLAQLQELYPEKYDPNLVSSSIGASVPVSTQWAQRIQRQAVDNREADAVRSDGTRRYVADQSDATRNRGISVTAETADKNRGSRESEGAKNRDVRVGNNVRNNQVKKDIAAMPARPKNNAPPTDPNKIIIQNGVKFRYNPSTKTYDPQ